MLAWACNGGLTGIYLLDTTAPGRNQIPNSRLAVRGVGDLVNNQILQQVLLTADGRTVVALTVLSYTRHGLPTLKLAEFSASTGKLLRVLNHLPVSNFKQVMWSSPSGQALLVSNTTPYQGRRSAFLLLNDAGVLTGQHFAPLPHWSLDTLAAAW
jgi:hypothetical protein